jgi:hypothetical protein
MTGTEPSVEPPAGERDRSVPLVHLIPIGLLLVLSSFFVGHDGYVFIDEAALHAQVELVGDGSWTTGRPLADVDRQGVHAPMARSTLTDDGFAPFPNHPLHVLVARVAAEVGGDTGVRMLSVLGVLGATMAAGGLAAARSRRHSAVAMWITGVASPLVFDANLVLAHAMAAAVTGAAFVLVFRTAPRIRTARAGVTVAIAVGALIATGALLRSEVVLLGAVTGLVAVVHGVRDRTGPVVMVGVAAVAGAATTYLLEPLWIEAVTGSSTSRKVIAASSRGGVTGAAEGALTVLFGRGDAGAALVVSVLFATAAVLGLRMRPTEPMFAVLLAGGGFLAAGVHLTDPSIVPGFVWAFPLLAAGAAAVSPRQLWPVAIRRSSQAVGLFALAVLLTQYSVGGGAEWGWRYVAVALPAVGAALSIPLVDRSRTTPPAARLAVSGVVLVGVLVPFSGILAQRQAAARVERLLDRTDAALQTSDADLIIAADASFGRYAWPRSIAGEVVTARGGERDLDRLLAHLRERDVERILLVWSGPEPAVPGDRARAGGDVTTLLERAYVARTYDLVPNERSPS